MGSDELVNYSLMSLGRAGRAAKPGDGLGKEGWRNTPVGILRSFGEGGPGR